MTFSDGVLNVLLGAAGSLLAIFILSRFEAGRQLLGRWYGLRYRLGSTLARGGFTRMTLSRAEYHTQRTGTGTLREYLATAQRSIDVVSISMNVTQAEGSLIGLFENKLSEGPDFVVRVSLLNPRSTVVPLLAKSLDLQPDELVEEILDTLRQLARAKSRLPEDAGRRLQVLTHDTLPIGSAILLDATPMSGRIQVETKLYRAPRTESFGFELTGPSDFFQRNFTSWQRVIRDSNPWVL